MLVPISKQDGNDLKQVVQGRQMPTLLFFKFRWGFGTPFVTFSKKETREVEKNGEYSEVILG